MAFRQISAARNFQQRDPAVRVFLQELRGARSAADDVHLHQAVRDFQVLADQAYFVAVARGQVVVQRVWRRSFDDLHPRIGTRDAENTAAHDFDDFAEGGDAGDEFADLDFVLVSSTM